MWVGLAPGINGWGQERVRFEKWIFPFARKTRLYHTGRPGEHHTHRVDRVTEILDRYLMSERLALGLSFWLRFYILSIPISDSHLHTNNITMYVLEIRFCSDGIQIFRNRCAWAACTRPQHTSISPFRDSVTCLSKGGYLRGINIISIRYNTLCV